MVGCHLQRYGSRRPHRIRGFQELQLGTPHGPNHGRCGSGFDNRVAGGEATGREESGGVHPRGGVLPDDNHSEGMADRALARGSCGSEVAGRLRPMGALRLLAGDPYQSDDCRSPATMCRTRRCTEWPPPDGARQFGSRGGAAIGGLIVRHEHHAGGSDRVLARPVWPDFVFAFHMSRRTCRALRAGGTPGL